MHKAPKNERQAHHVLRFEGAMARRIDVDRLIASGSIEGPYRRTKPTRRKPLMQRVVDAVSRLLSLRAVACR